MFRRVVACLLQPNDRFIRVRFQQVHVPDLFVPDPEFGITGTEPDGSLYERDRLLDRVGVELALTESEVSVNIVATVRERRLVFRDGFRISALGTQQMGFGDMRQRAAK